MMALEIKIQIIINASPQKVWDTFINFNEYPNWNPFIKTISGATSPGEQLSVTIQAQGNKPMNFTPIVLVNKTNKEFRWKGKLFVPGLFDGEHYFILEEINPMKTRFIHGENFTGVLSGVFLKMIAEDTKKGFEAMNLALKLLVESSL